MSSTSTPNAAAGVGPRAGVRARLARLGVPEPALAGAGRVLRTSRLTTSYLAAIARRSLRRAGNRVLGLPARRELPAWNMLFRRDLLPLLERERRLLEAFDEQLASRLNERRLVGQILFEYGTLLNAIPSWEGLTVLDVGTGGSRLPRWMASSTARSIE